MALELTQIDNVQYNNVHLDPQYSCDACGMVISVPFTDTQYALDTTENRLYIFHTDHAASLPAPIQALAQDWIIA